MNTLVPVQDDTLCVQLRDLVKPLGHIHHQQTYNKFKTFTKLITNSPKQNVLPFKSDIYTDSAMAFAMWINPDKGCDFIQAVVNAQPEPVPVPYFHAKTCNKHVDIQVAKVYT